MTLWDRWRRRSAPNDRPTDLLADLAALRSPSGFATVLVDDVTRFPPLAGFADTIDRGALSQVTEGIEGIESNEIAGVISRPSGNFRWEPHPVFEHVGVPPIHIGRAELMSAGYSRPTATTPVPLYTITAASFARLSFWIKDLDLS
ncbi:hypothetical protein ACFZAG_39980 [Streptomyces sp. NPDC012403]|uniref:hypothetical protein n=1 Tax=unclassified Streptomyces TaxID=2593676 RepID=UPI001C2496DE|nr:hypothetical protein [Streptomyces sp. AC558_RSS880]